jgi:hypothetical protein
VRRVDRVSTSKVVHVIQIRHRDEVEAPVTDWLREAYEFSDARPAKGEPTRTKSKPKPTSRARVPQKTVAARKPKGR